MVYNWLIMALLPHTSKDGGLNPASDVCVFVEFAYFPILIGFPQAIPRVLQFFSLSKYLHLG